MMPDESLRAKFQALREFVETIPAEKLDMRFVHPADGECGCVQFHGLRDGGSGFASIAELYEGLPKRAHKRLAHLFDVDGISGVSCYPIPTGQPAKDEFLRRLSVLEEKYCLFASPPQTPTRERIEKWFDDFLDALALGRVRIPTTDISRRDAAKRYTDAILSLFPAPPQMTPSKLTDGDVR